MVWVELEEARSADSEGHGARNMLGAEPGTEYILQVLLLLFRLSVFNTYLVVRELPVCDDTDVGIKRKTWRSKTIRSFKAGNSGQDACQGHV